MRWDPEQYGRYADERGRPFRDLLARVFADRPRRAVDLGCGPGTLTALLSDRWPDAVIEGVDSSAEMIAKARPLATDRLSFRVGDVADWAPPPDADVVVSNATLQWVPGHRELIARWAAALPTGGWLAFQVPGNFAAAGHRLMRELAGAPRWAERLAGVLRHHDAVAEPLEYARVLDASGLRADVWETTYLHVLTGPDPVLEWLRGTGLRPVLAVLDEAEGAEFCADLATRLREAYPPGQSGTIFPFRRIFAVGHKAA
jgi:trans-aconitate 2-methyltransferase